MRIAIYAGTFKKDQDGFVKTVYELLGSMQRCNFQPAIWSPISTPHTTSVVSVHEVASLPLPFSGGYHAALPSAKAAGQLDHFGPDVIHIGTPDIGGYGFLRYARRRHLPVVATYHTHFPSYLRYLGLGFLERPLWRYLVSFYNHCDRTFVPTATMAAQLEAAGIDNIRIWGRGIDRDLYHPRFRSPELRTRWGAKQKKVLLYAGRFVPYKGLDVFGRVYDLFQSRNRNDTVFVLVGDGPLRQRLCRRMPRAIFPGYLVGRELSAAYASADILLFPSTTETFGNVVLEAISSGLPAVVSSVGGCREIVQTARAGMVATADNPGSFFRACRALVEDWNHYRLLRRNGLSYAESRSWEKINAIIINAYLELSGNGHQLRPDGTDAQGCSRNLSWCSPRASKRFLRNL